MRPDCWLFTLMFSMALSVVPRKFVLSVPALPVTSHAPVAASASAVLGVIFFHDCPVLYQNEFVLISYTNSPCVLAIFILASLLMRGISNPLLNDLMSRI